MLLLHLGTNKHAHRIDRGVCQLGSDDLGGKREAKGEGDKWTCHSVHAVGQYPVAYCGFNAGDCGPLRQTRAPIMAYLVVSIAGGTAVLSATTGRGATRQVGEP